MHLVTKFNSCTCVINKCVWVCVPFPFLSLSLEESRLITEKTSKISFTEQPKLTGKGE